jgi:hypothetical protein
MKKFMKINGSFAHLAVAEKRQIFEVMNNKMFGECAIDLYGTFIE